MIKTTIVAALLSAAAVSSAHADLLVDHPPTHAGGPGADTSFYNQFTGEPAWELSADNFRLTADTQVNRLSWFGFYGSTFGGTWNPPSGSETMRLRFYDARPSDGLPGMVLYEQTFLNPLRIATGRHVEVGQPEYRFQVDLPTPLNATANKAYWMEVTQIGDIDSHFRWEDGLSNTSPFATVFSTIPDWMYYENNIGLAFQLESVPEPATLTGVLFAIAIFSQSTRSRRHR